MDSLRNAAHGAFKKAAEAVLPPLTKSQFEEKRVRARTDGPRSVVRATVHGFSLPLLTPTPPPSRSSPAPS